MGAAPERCLVVEDSDSGVRAARAAGARKLLSGGAVTLGEKYNKSFTEALLDRMPPGGAASARLVAPMGASRAVFDL